MGIPKAIFHLHKEDSKGTIDPFCTWTLRDWPAKEPVRDTHGCDSNAQRHVEVIDEQEPCQKTYLGIRVQGVGSRLC